MFVGQTPSAMTHEPIARPSKAQLVCSTGRRTTNDDRFGYLWRCDWRCWSIPIARTHKPTARPRETPSEMLVDSD